MFSVLLAFCVQALPQVQGAALPSPQDPPKAGAAGTEGAPSSQKSLSEQLSPAYAFLIGALGGSAYLIAAWAGFVGKDDSSRDRVLKYFGQSGGFVLVPAYIVTAGGIALVFQLPERGLVPIQAFIIGCTWPAVVSNYLSGRQSGDGGEKELEKIQAAAKETLQQEKVANSLPTAPLKPPQDLAEKLNRLEALVGGPGGTPPGPQPGSPPAETPPASGTGP